MTTAPAGALGRARGVVVVGMAWIVAASWSYLGLLSTRSGTTSALSMPMTSAWSLAEVVLMTTMWAVMMAAMMLPSAVPMVLAYDRMDRGSSDERGGSVALFVTGYVAAWAVFAVAATGLQWGLHHLALLDGMGAATQRAFAGSLLVAAGIVQFSPVKKRTLGACRTPLGFLLTSWRDGRGGAVRMGLHHGTLCLGCCAALMILLFVLGVMNLLWVAALAVFVLVEKMSKRGEVISVVGGIVMIVWGAGVVVGG